MTSTLIKRIALPVAMLVVVAAAAVAGTGAFFSDTETSTGNTFTAGSIDLKIDSEQHYNGNTCEEISQDVYQWVGDAPYPEAGTPCTGTWDLKDLSDDSATGDKFFNFDDIKPGDSGENTISIHIESNDAYMCASLENVVEADNTKTEPEALDDPDGLAVGEATGELDDILYFFAWVDDGAIDGWQGTSTDATEGDNVYQIGEQPLNAPTAASTLVPTTWALADSTVNGGTPLSAGDTHYVGVAWCAGSMTVDSSTGAISCDGSTVNNASQTDSWSTDVKFDVVQARNNTNFECNPTPAPQVTVASDDGWASVPGHWIAKARNTNSNYELEIGRGSGDRDEDEFAWVDNQALPFTLTFNSTTGEATLDVNGTQTVYNASGADVTSFTSLTGSANGALALHGKASSGNTIQIELVSLNLQSVGPVTLSGTTSLLNDGTGSEIQHLVMTGLDMSQGFTLSGNVTVDRGGSTTDERPAMEIHVQP